MKSRSSSSGSLSSVRSGLPLATKSFIGFLSAVFAVVIIAALSYTSLRAAADGVRSVAHTVEAMAQLNSVLTSVKDAETGQRGFLLTGNENYLDPYSNARNALPGEFDAVKTSMADDPEQRHRLEALQVQTRLKLEELASTISLRRDGKQEAALAIVVTDRGKLAMDRIRALVAQMLATENQALESRTVEAKRAATASAIVTLGGSALLLALIGVSATLASREFRALRLEGWLRTGHMRLAEHVLGDQALEALGSQILASLAQYLEAQVGAIYIADGGQLRRCATYALPVGFESSLLRPGDGLTGQAARDNRAFVVHDVPVDYLPVGSAMGSGTPAALLIAPASVDGLVQAVVEFGFFGTVDSAKLDLMKRVAEPIAIAVRTAKDRSRLEELLQETQTQSEELQASAEELRVSNEELEEQGRALKEAAAQMETQQAELEQINSQLEEQTQMLEHQRDELAAQGALLTARAEELQRANDYKSEFLANMSHELRTPLNSTLILAKLLADNKDGNLTEKQVKFAQTIGSAGNDLLNLINDVLDLSRIEAGKVDLQPEIVSIAQFVESLTKTFQPSAQHKGLRFSVSVEPGTPPQFETDPQRLGQIVKNLLSNAIKFTPSGSVELRVSAPSAETLTFAVRDTGVGIEPHQQDVIFEAFRQADGSIHRRFGGTGLGLSISRDLAQLLGGSIAVQSAPQQGSVFSLTLPRVFVAVSEAAPSAAVTTAVVGVPAARRPLQPITLGVLSDASMEDDRKSLVAGGRVILVIEDDQHFALVLRDVAREMAFQCIVTHTANDGLLAALQFQPSAILLDINLPDHSGLGVLDQLKRDPRTRHIPVHVASVADYRKEALELGAIGYALKPAQREQLVEALRRVEDKLEQHVRRVLIVEDDPRQRESIEQLLSNEDVQITAVESAADALAQLRSATFDCMVVDFNLPDLSGYDLLETMSKQEDVAFPPVIVYTGRVLSREEEQRLRRYSRSIIIKDARSPERLLDEVTLFLHQVEARLPPERQQMLKSARSRESALEGRRILVVEDDVRNIFALSSVLEPKGATIEIARNGREAIEALVRNSRAAATAIDLVLMDIMMPEMDGLTAMREIRKLTEFKRLPIIALTAKAMKDDQDKCLAAGANDYIAKPLDVEKLLSLVRVWMPK